MDEYEFDSEELVAGDDLNATLPAVELTPAEKKRERNHCVICHQLGGWSFERLLTSDTMICHTPDRLSSTNNPKPSLNL